MPFEVRPHEVPYESIFVGVFGHPQALLRGMKTNEKDLFIRSMIVENPRNTYARKWRER